MSNNQKRNAGLPEDIQSKIADYLKNVPDKLMAILCYFSDYEESKTQTYITFLRSVIDNNKAFNGIMDKLVEDTEKLKNDPNFLRVMADIWNQHLKPNEKKNVGDDGQRFDFTLVLADTNLTFTTYNFIVTISKLHPAVQEQVIQLMINAAETTADIAASSQSLNNLIQVSRSTAEKIVSVDLVTDSSTSETLKNLKIELRDKLSWKRRVKNIIDSCAEIAGGIGGGLAGASIGIRISPGNGTAIGAIVGGIAGSTMTGNLSDWSTRYIFKLPRNVALENAYDFLGLNYRASNDEINSNFWHLALKYHPGNGGTKEDWVKLQYCMSTIKLSKGEI